MSSKGIVLAILIMALGAAWLLNTLHVLGGVDWVWTGSIGAAGILTLAWTKVNKVTFLVGSFLLIGSVFSVLRQRGQISPDVEVPILVIVFGVLFLVAQLPMIPLPEVIVKAREEAAKQKSDE